MVTSSTLVAIIMVCMNALMMYTQNRVSSLRRDTCCHWSVCLCRLQSA